MMRSTLCVTLAAFLVSFAGCKHATPGRQRVHMVIAGSPSVITYLPHVVATQLDLYRKAGLTVEIESVNGGTHGLQALIGGSCDVVLGFMDHPMRVASQGQELRAFVALTRYPGNVVIVSPAASKRIHRIEDLKGA